ncbi:Fe-S cluster assembly protein HesB [Nakamurella sp. DB0629]|uniref:Fe-S cluster assembly protein HesB n=2 Tax=Nakamurella aerolata TaxID=1656892 RepID=A0A849A9J5_9ACTN|nr:Fe-S cluster assembly protein HesB [Nakamurella aerolata]
MLNRMTATSMFLTGNDAADQLLAGDGNALLLGMVLDQQVPMEKAFSGPAVIAERMGGTLDVAAIAAADPEEFAALCARPPAVHRFPGSMAGRLQAVSRVLMDDYDGNAENLWSTADSGAELKRRLQALPGFGPQKAAIFVALLGKQYGVTPDGWRQAAGDYGADGSRISVADVTDPESLQQVRAAKKAAKAAAKAAKPAKAAEPTTKAAKPAAKTTATAKKAKA